MKPSWTLLVVIAVVALMVVSVGCKKAPPETPVEEAPAPEPPPPPPEPEEVAPPPAPRVEDRTPDPLDADIQTADQHARTAGMIGDIYFDFDKYDLKAEARERLGKNAEFLKKNPQFTLTIEGHCDERGTNDYNIALGDRRANAAREYLVSLGVTTGRIRTVTFGEERPVCTESNESCWWRNRRGEFHLSGRG